MSPDCVAEERFALLDHCQVPLHLDHTSKKQCDACCFLGRERRLHVCGKSEDTLGSWDLVNHGRSDTSWLAGENMHGTWIHVEVVPWQLLFIYFSSKCEKQVAFIMSERWYSDTIFQEFWFWQSKWTSAAVASSRTFCDSGNILHVLRLHVVATGHTQLLLVFWNVASVSKDWIFNLI